MVMIAASILVLVFLFLRYRVATPFPLEKIKLAEGKEKFTELITHTKKPTVVSFYAHWCGECLMEMNDWINYENGIILKNFEIILISDKENAGVRMIQSRFPELHNIFISELPVSEYSIYAFPTNYVFNSDGKLMWKSVGSVSPESLKTLINTNE